MSSKQTHVIIFIYKNCLYCVFYKFIGYIDYDAASITTMIHIGEEETSVVIPLYSDCDNETTEMFTVNFTIPESLKDEVTTGLANIVTVNIINSPSESGIQACYVTFS